MINWGIIGLGNMANRFASSLNDVKNTKLLGVASRSFLRLKRFGDKYNIEKKYRYRSYDEILNCNEINAIYISTLNNTHTEIILKAIEAKKNILCEKPIATNYDDTVKIFEKLNNSGVFFLEGIAYRSHEQTKFVVNKIIEGEIGDLKSGGSSSNTSIAAPAIFPDLTPSTTSCSLTIPPLAQLIIITPSFIRPIVPLEIKSLVAPVKGV